MNYVLEYWNAIKTGKIVTSRRVRAVYERLAREIRRPRKNSPYYFDEEVGERPILFAEKFCKQSQGVIGAPLKRVEAAQFLTNIGALELDQVLGIFGFPPIGGEEGKRRVQTLNMANAEIVDKYQLTSAGSKDDPPKEDNPQTEEHEENPEQDEEQEEKDNAD